MIKPDPGRPRWAAKVRRAAPALIAVAALVGLASIAIAAGSFGSAAASQGPPGEQPAVQKWMKDREAAQIELNNALVPFVHRQAEVAAAARPACTRLAEAVRVLSKHRPAPNRQVDQLARAGLAKLEQASAACMAGDLAGAQRLIKEALAERTAAQAPLDELLEGE